MLGNWNLIKLFFNLYFFQVINNYSAKWWSLDWLGIFFAQYLPYIFVAAAIYLLIRQKNLRQRIYFFSLAALSVILARGIITEVIRFIFPKDRPFVALSINPLVSHDLSSAFPSGHASAYFALALAVFFINRKIGIWFLIGAFVMAIARIFVGVHWPLDIIAGALIGLASALLIKTLLPTIEIDTTNKNPSL